MRSLIVKKNYSKFSKAEGNQHIASEYAITKIVRLAKHFKPRKVLEVGLGIGSISGTLLQTFNPGKLEICGTETNKFCLQALKKNLGEDHKRLKIYPDLKSVYENSKFDLIIIDGSDGNLKMVDKYISNNAIIVIEGDREEQFELLKDIFPSHLYVHSISMRRNKESAPFSSNNWQGGLKIIFINPGVYQKVWWLREKLFTKLKYLYRALKK